MGVRIAPGWMELQRIGSRCSAQYSATDGVPGDHHLVHLGARAMGGAGPLQLPPGMKLPPGFGGKR